MQGKGRVELVDGSSELNDAEEDKSGDSLAIVWLKADVTGFGSLFWDPLLINEHESGTIPLPNFLLQYNN